MSELPPAPTLNPQQQQAVLAVMRDYLAAPGRDPGKNFAQEEADTNAARISLIEKELGPLVNGFLAGTLPLAQFKSRVDGLNKKHNHWGFRGVKGQMFFNLLVNASEGAPEELDQELKAVLAEPANETLAASRLKTFESYVKRIGDTSVETGKSTRSRPSLGSIPFFVSYFWQVQERNVWPIYFTTTVQVLAALSLWQPTENLAEDYLSYKRLHEELAALFTSASGRTFTLYDVEHVFWFKGGNPFRKDADPLGAIVVGSGGTDTPAAVSDSADERVMLPDSYVPPVVAVLPLFARHDAKFTDAAKRAGTSIERAFERGIDAAFTILGYETKLLGQGAGRVPDGLAVAHDQNYAIIWDGKVRCDGYSMGTDDRVIRDYVTTQSRELKRRGYLRNIYYCIVSSAFAEDYEEPIASLKMETDVNEIVLLEASALVAMVDTKLRDPLHVSLGPDGIQRLFTTSGVLNAEKVRELLN